MPPLAVPEPGAAADLRQDVRHLLPREVVGAPAQLQHVREDLVQGTGPQRLLDHVILRLLKGALPAVAGRAPVVQQQLPRLLIRQPLDEAVAHHRVKGGDHPVLPHQVIGPPLLARHQDCSVPGAGRVAVEDVAQLGGAGPQVVPLPLPLQQGRALGLPHRQQVTVHHVRGHALLAGVDDVEVAHLLVGVDPLHDGHRQGVVRHPLGLVLDERPLQAEQPVLAVHHPHRQPGRDRQHPRLPTAACPRRLERRVIRLPDAHQERGGQHALLLSHVRGHLTQPRWRQGPLVSLAVIVAVCVGTAASQELPQRQHRGIQVHVRPLLAKPQPEDTQRLLGGGLLGLLEDRGGGCHRPLLSLDIPG